MMCRTFWSNGFPAGDHRDIPQSLGVRDEVRLSRGNARVAAAALGVRVAAAATAV